MNLSKMLSSLLLLSVLLSGATTCAIADSGSETGSIPTVPSVSATQREQTRVVAMYFHQRIRCRSCREIEALSRKAIQDDFKAELSSGRLTFTTFSLADRENDRFIREFGLGGSMLVLAEFRGDELVRWNRMDRVWELLGDEAGFRQYVAESTRAYLIPAK